MNALATQAATKQQFDLSPQTFEQALTFAQYLADSDMVPKQYRGKAGDCLIAMQWGFEIGLKPLQALQSIAPINGKPNLYGDAGKALLLDAGCLIEEDDIETIKANGMARCKITRPGRPPVTRTFSIENAQKAGLWNKDGPWRQYPERQMAWRAFWFAARDAAADLLRGMGGAEEAMDYQQAATKDMGPAEEVRPTTVEDLPLYDSEKFEENLKAWTGVIQSGRKTPDQIIDMVQTKARLSDEQKARIRAAGVVDNDTGAVGDQADPRTPLTNATAGVVDSTVSPKVVEKRLRAAKSTDELDLAADQIREVADPDQSAALTNLYRALRAQLEE